MGNEQVGAIYRSNDEKIEMFGFGKVTEEVPDTDIVPDNSFASMIAEQGRENPV